MSNTRSLFLNVAKSVYEYRDTTDLADGRAFWQPIKASLSPFDNVTFDWKPLSKDQYDFFMNREEFDCNNNMIEENHFLMQLGRIPTTESGNIRKLMQLALNIGQYNQYADKNGLETVCVTIDTFVDQETIEWLDNEVKI